MANKNKPITDLKVVNYKGDLEVAMLVFDLRMISTISPKGNRQYTLYEERDPSYLLIVSQSREFFISRRSYNVVVSMTSESQERNNSVLKRLEDRTGIALKDQHFMGEQELRSLGQTYKLIKECGKKILDSLRT